jgi:[CysO sulfur-carrier protein]-S-L-cysteine hydrolase
MNLLIPSDVAGRMTEALAQAGKREIGGVLMGEHVGPDTFRVCDLTIQRKGGTFAAFLRVVGDIIGPLRAFFQNTQHNYTRFNYMGEWHSHHSFALTPSGRDHSTMFEIIDDSQLGARFVVLLLVRLAEDKTIQANVTVYLPNRDPYSGCVTLEPKKPS